jgi:hypothetical protein
LRCAHRIFKPKLCQIRFDDYEYAAPKKLDIVWCCGKQDLMVVKCVDEELNKRLLFPSGFS